jgi:hypothetical protein
MSKIWKILSAHGYIYHRLHTTNLLIQSHIGRKDKSATMIKVSLCNYYRYVLYEYNYFVLQMYLGVTNTFCVS